jgi:hypothetical protein
MNQPTVLQLREWGTLASAFDTTEIGLGRLTVAKNAILRPYGAIKGVPKYERLWEIGISQTVQATMRALPFTGFPGGIGATAPDRATNKCCAVRIYRQGKNFLFFYDLINDKSRGLFYMGDDGTYTSGAYDFADGPPSYEVLAVGLDATAYWYGKRIASMLKLSNNVDVPVCVQLNRTAVPGKWRLAGSNVAPAAAVISKVPTSTQLTTQAYWTIAASAAIKVIADPGTDALWSYTTSDGIASVSTTQDRLYSPYLGVKEFMVVFFVGTNIPGGLSPMTRYVCRNVSGGFYQLSLTNTGPIINITNTTTGGLVCQAFTHGLEAAAEFTFTAAAVPPVNLSTGTYYVSPYTDYAFRVTASPGGLAIDIGSTGTPTTANTATPSNNRVKVAIQNTPYSTDITSTRLGSGTTTDPYIYTITTGNTAASSSNDAIVAYVNADSLAVGILRASTATPNATVDSGSWAATTLLNGVGSGTSTGLTAQTVSVYLRYFDAGNDRLGYEGISSEKSNEIILTSTETSDILVTITPNPSAEGGRFGFIRVYMQFGEGAAAIWNLVGTVANTAGTKTLQVGTNTVIGQAMSADQNRLLPFKDVVMVRGQVWHGGNLTNPEYLYVSKVATDDEIAPEGASILDPFIVTLPEQPSDFYITALDTDDYRLHVHTNLGVVLMNPLNPVEDRHVPQVPVGALNPDCLVKWEKSQIYYLGSDMSVYQFDGARYGRRNASAATKDAIQFILSKADLNRVSREPDRVTAWLDTRSELLYYHFPAADNTLNGFCFDFRANGVVGELTYPKVSAMTEMEPERPERVWCDEEGNLFFINSLTQNDWGDALPASPAFTPHSTATPMPAQYNGWGYVDFQGKRYYQATETVLETGFVDLTDPTKYKTWCGFEWLTVKNSRALVEVTFTNLNGQSVTRYYGDLAVFGKNRPHKVTLNMGGSAVKIKMRVITAEQAPWIVRNAALLYRPGGMY